MRWLGERSYAIYLWHWPICVLTRPDVDIPVTGWANSVLRLALALGLAELSYRYVERPFRSPLGIPGAVVTIIIGLVTVYYQLSDPVYRVGVIAVACWFVIGIVYFALFARHRMILSPEEEFAMEHVGKI